MKSHQEKLMTTDLRDAPEQIAFNGDPHLVYQLCCVPGCESGSWNGDGPLSQQAEPLPVLALLHSLTL